MQKKGKLIIIIAVSVILVAGIAGTVGFLVSQNSSFRAQNDALRQSVEAMMTSETEAKPETTQAPATTTAAATTTTTTQATTAQQDNTVRAVVTAEPSLNLREGPDAKTDKLASLKTGTVLEVLRYQDSTKEWAYIYAPSEDKYGWVSAKYLEIRTAEPGTQPVGFSEQSTGSYGTEEWIKVSCPLCNGGRDLKVCPNCKGKGKLDNLIMGPTTCYECFIGDHDGYLRCELCGDRYYIKMRNYETDPSVPKPAELAAKVRALGPKPQSDFLCSYCNGGTKLKKCPNWTEGEKHRCSNCYNGYIKCTHCDYGIIKNKDYDVEVTDWNLKLDAITSGVVDYSKTPEQQQADAAMASMMAEANALIMRDSELINSGGVISGNRSAPSMCKHCYGTGRCHLCNGTGRMKNSYTGGRQKCSACGGSGDCPYC